MHNTDYPGLLTSTAAFKAIYNSQNMDGEMGDFIHKDHAYETYYRQISGNLIIDELNKKRAEIANFETLKAQYIIDRDTYNTQLNALIGRQFDLWYYLFPTTRPAAEVITVPTMPDRPAIPTAYDWMHWPTTIANSPFNVLEAYPFYTIGGFGFLTAGIMGGDIQGKSFGLIGPSKTSGSLSAAEQGIASTRAKMTSPCTTHYMAVTVLARSDYDFIQSASETIEIEIGAYAWGTYDWTIPTLPTLPTSIDLGAISLKSLVFGSLLTYASIFN